MYGDLMTDSSYPARGARVTVIRPYPEPAVGFFLDDEGCGSFDSQFPTGHKVLLHTETVLGLGTSGQIHIKTFPSEIAMVSNMDTFCEFDIADLPEGWEVDADCPETGPHLVTLIATATEVIDRLHSLDGSLLAGEHTLKIWLDPTIQNASAPLGQVRLGTAGQEQDASALGKKFILGHEIGHWIQEEVTGGYWSVHYGYGPVVPDPDDEPLDPHPDTFGDPRDLACRFAVEYVAPETEETPDQLESHPNRHGIRSAEFASGAMPEGFGHFVAAVAFNSDLSEDADGFFRYYKDAHHDLTAYDEFEDPSGQDRQVSLRGGSGSETFGGPDRWVELQCSQACVIS